VELASQYDSRLKGYGVAYGRSGNRLAFVDGEGNSSGHNYANARLIAAAPELLDALSGLAEWVLLHSRYPASCEPLKVARAALAKATQSEVK
jgi:hypothetical protein